MRARAAFITSSIVWLALTPLVAAAQDALPAAGAPCADAVHRQFDFWIGEWEVRAADGTLLGHNSITSIHGGCALAERWRGASGGTGSSLNAYDASADRWRQMWIGSDGTLLELEGRLEPDGIVLTGSTRRADGRAVLHRITWTPVAGRAVRQLWEVSLDEGRSWRSSFDGTYRMTSGGANRR